MGLFKKKDNGMRDYLAERFCKSTDENPLNIEILDIDKVTVYKRNVDSIYARITSWNSFDGKITFEGNPLIFDDAIPKFFFDKFIK